MELIITREASQVFGPGTITSLIRAWVLRSGVHNVIGGEVTLDEDFEGNLIYRTRFDSETWTGRTAREFKHWKVCRQAGAA